MDPPLFYWAPSGDASLLTLRISRSLFPNMAIATEVIMTDQCIVSYVAAICQLHMRRCTRAQSEMDIVSNDSDGTEHGAPDAVAGVVCPLRVKSVSESKRMRRPWAVLAKDALRLGLRLLGGGRPASMEPKRWLPKPPRGSAEAGASIYCGTLDRGL